MVYVRTFNIWLHGYFTERKSMQKPMLFGLIIILLRNRIFVRFYAIWLVILLRDERVIVGLGCRGRGCRLEHM